MRVIYRSASKRRLTPLTPTREILNRLLSHLKEFFSWLGIVRSALIQFYLHGLAWVAVWSMILPWVGPLILAIWFWRSWTVPWLFRRLSSPGDKLETSVKVRGIGSGLHHMVLKFDGSPSLNAILERLDKILHQRSAEPDGWKLKRSLVGLSLGCWAWRSDENFCVENHVTLCEEGAPLNCKTLKYKINELCGVPVDGRHSPWHVHVVPYVQKETRVPCYALLVRAHHLIAHLFSGEDFCVHDSDEKHLRSALVYALSQNGNACKNKVQLEDTNHVKMQSRTRSDRFWSVLNLVWMSPAVLIQEMACCVRHVFKYRKFIQRKSMRALSWSDSISKDLVRRLTEASKAESEEAVLFSCLSGALHHYSRVSGSAEIRGDSMRVLVPKGNGFVRITMPVGESCSMARLRRVQSSLRKGKLDAKYKLSCFVASLWSRVLPTSVGSYLASLFCLRYPAVVDSFHVPASDSSILEVNYWKLAAVDIGLSLTFAYYADHLSLSVVSDFQTLQRPDVLASCFGRAVLDLALAYNVRYERKPSPPSTPVKYFSGRF